MLANDSIPFLIFHFFYNMSSYIESKDVIMAEIAAAEEVSGEAAAPFFIIKPVVQRLIEGGSVIFECQVGGNPKPHVYWKKAGLPVTTGYRYNKHFIVKCNVYMV